MQTRGALSAPIRQKIEQSGEQVTWTARRPAPASRRPCHLVCGGAWCSRGFETLVEDVSRNYEQVESRFETAHWISTHKYAVHVSVQLKFLLCHFFGAIKINAVSFKKKRVRGGAPLVCGDGRMDAVDDAYAGVRGGLGPAQKYVGGLGGYRVKVRRVNGEVNLSREAAESVQCPMTDTLF